jgi:hypothetical protein
MTGNLMYILRHSANNLSYPLQLKDSHIASPPRKPSLGSAAAQSDAIRSSYDWIKGVNTLLMELDNSFSKTVHAWKSFEKGDMLYFTGPCTPGEVSLLLHEARKTFEEIENVQAKLAHIENLAMNFKQQVSAHERPYRLPQMTNS